ncbi:MAG TPA: hypothetical protein VF435_18015 [Pyrinomonadaceae bacterium]
MRSRSKFLRLVIVVIFAVAEVVAQAPDFAGRWAGTLTTSLNGHGGLEITLAQADKAWKGTLKLRVGGQEVAPVIEELKIDGEQISFTAAIDQTRIKFAGKIAADKLDGTLEAFQAERKVSEGSFTLTRGGQMPSLQQLGGVQMADADFDASVSKPAYSENGPKILFDEAHNNFHTATGRYKPFVDLITNDGYHVTPNKTRFTPETLQGYGILIIANALGHERMSATEASNPAFTDEESDVVRDWVKGGGALLLIADHAPMGAANQILAQRFDVDMSKSYTIDPDNHDKDSKNRGFIVYTRESGRLADHPITRGRNANEQVNRVIAFTGQSLKGPAASVAFLKLADTALDQMPGSNSQRTSAAGRAQGIALKYGKGRVIIMGEAAMLTAQVITGPNPIKFGMNRPGIDNRQLALNIMHWLSGLLK